MRQPAHAGDIGVTQRGLSLSEVRRLRRGESTSAGKISPPASLRRQPEMYWFARLSGERKLLSLSIVLARGRSHVFPNLRRKFEHWHGSQGVTHRPQIRLIDAAGLALGNVLAECSLLLGGQGLVQTRLNRGPCF